MNNDLREPIEKVYPEAYRLARKFHELYEEYAPQFGYITREDTKEFDPSSPNGRTMAKVCYEIVEEEIEKALSQRDQALREWAMIFIAEEANIAREEGIPTSRVTALGNKILALLEPANTSEQ